MESEELNTASSSSIDLEELGDIHNLQMDDTAIEVEEIGDLEDTQSRKMVYRKLLNDLDVIEESEELGMKTAKEIGKIIKTVNIIETEHNITTRYQYPDEILLDSKVLSTASGVLVKCIDVVDDSAAPYDGSQFAQNIIKFCKPEGDFDGADLFNLVSEAQKIIPEVPAYNCLYGSYDLMNLPKPKQKKPKEKRQKDNVFEKKAPEKLTKVDKEEESIDETLTLLYDVLEQQYKRNNDQPIKYYDYIIDTSDFAATIENMFYFSFLIKDGRASITLDGKNVPYVKPMKKRDLEQYREEGGCNGQIISSISVAEWQTYKKEGYIQQYKKSLCDKN